MPALEFFMHFWVNIAICLSLWMSDWLQVDVVGGECVFVRYVCIRVLVCLPSTERGAVGDHMDTERPPVAWKLHCPRQGAANKTHAYRKKKKKWAHTQTSLKIVKMRMHVISCTQWYGNIAAHTSRISMCKLFRNHLHFPSGDSDRKTN